MSHRKSDKGVSNQGRLFDTREDGALDVRLAFRDAVFQALRAHPESRWNVAAHVSRLGGHELTKDMLDKCTSSNLDYGLRAEDLPALCDVLGTYAPARALFLPIGADVVSPEEGEYLRLLRLEREQAQIGGEIARLKSKLGMTK